MSGEPPNFNFIPDDSESEEEYNVPINFSEEPPPAPTPPKTPRKKQKKQQQPSQLENPQPPVKQPSSSRKTPTKQPPIKQENEEQNFNSFNLNQLVNPGEADTASSNELDHLSRELDLLSQELQNVPPMTLLLPKNQ